MRAREVHARGRRSLLVLVAAAVGLCASPAAAQDPSEPDFDADLARCHVLVKAERWKDGEEAARALFRNYLHDRRVITNLRAIEDDLKLCLFRRKHRRPTGEDLFGEGTKSFSHTSRRIEFEFAKPAGSLWTALKDGAHLFDVRLGGKTSISMTGVPALNGKVNFAIFVCYDPEKGGGYMIKPTAIGFRAGLGEAVTISIMKVGKGEPEELDSVDTKGARQIDFEIRRSPRELRMWAGGRGASSGDRTYKQGYVAVLGSPTEILISGRVEKDHYLGRVSKYRNRAFREWVEAGYDRSKEIPAWARPDVAATSSADIGETPDDLPLESQALVGRLIDMLLMVEANADAPRAKIPERTEIEGPSGLYLRGLTDLCFGRHQSAEKTFTDLLGTHPRFAPARVFRGRARFRLRRLEEARADLEQGLKERPRYPHTYAFLAEFELYERDVNGAFEILARAETLGVRHPRLAAIRDIVHRARQGPRWTRDYEFRSKRFRVVSDLSLEFSGQVAKHLENAQKTYATDLAPHRGRKRPAVVYAFSDRASYLHYTKGLGMWVPMTAGLYSPRLRQLVLWVPLNRNDLWDTVRHEGFHQYLDLFVDDAPIWFHEGNAEWFGAERKVVKPRMIDHIDDYLGKLRPLDDLLLMSRRKFMTAPAVNYTQSHDLVMFLRWTSDARFKGLHDAYFRALRRGLSQQEAYEAIFEPVLTKLDAAFRSWVEHR